MVCSSPRRQRGLALLMAMLIVIIASTVAVSIIHGEKFTIRKSGHIQRMDRAALYAIAFNNGIDLADPEQAAAADTDDGTVSEQEKQERVAAST